MKSNVRYVFASEALNQFLSELFNLRDVAKGLIVRTASQLLYGGGKAIVGKVSNLHNIQISSIEIADKQSLN